MKGGNVYNKYDQSFGLQKLIVANWKNRILQLTNQSDAKTVHEIGCGEGEISRLIEANSRTIIASDVCPEVIELAKSLGKQKNSKVQFKQKDIYKLENESDSADLIICCEVLEHLEHPDTAINSIKRLDFKNVIFSVPAEPLWRILNLARGAYWKDMGNTPGHIQHWTPNAFVSLLSKHFTIEKVYHPIPWTVIYCSRRFK